MHVKTIRNPLYKNYEYFRTDAGAAFIFNPLIEQEEQERRETEQATINVASVSNHTANSSVFKSTPPKINEDELMKDYSPALRRFKRCRKESESDEFDMFNSDSLYEDFD